MMHTCFEGKSKLQTYIFFSIFICVFECVNEEYTDKGKREKNSRNEKGNTCVTYQALRAHGKPENLITGTHNFSVVKKKAFFFFLIFHFVLSTFFDSFPLLPSLVYVKINHKLEFIFAGNYCPFPMT